MIGRWIFGARLGKQTDQLATFAASLSFYFLITLAPFILSTLSILHLLYPADMSNALQVLLKEFFPKETDINLSSIVKQAATIGNRGVFSFQVVFAIWGTLRFMKEMGRALKFIFQDSPDSGSFFSRWSKTILLYVIWSATLTTAAFLMINFPIYLSRIEIDKNVPLLDIDLFTAGMRYLLIFLVPFLATTLTFKLLCPKKFKLSTIVCGALISTAGWCLNAWLFGFLVKHLWANHFLYGAMGSLFLALMWAYFSAWIYFAGAIFVAKKSEP